MRLAVIAGLPRSGSTLLCNLLAQHPDVYVSSTSALPTVLNQVTGIFNNSPEVTSDLIAAEDETRNRSLAVLRGIIDNWYVGHDGLVIDKSRGWGPIALLLKRLMPDAPIIVTVRDPREVFASVEKQHRASAEYGPHDKTMFERADEMLSPNGLIGGPIRWTEDLMRRRPPGLSIVSYDWLTNQTSHVMASLAEELGLDPHDHDLVNVESTATDADALYRFKYPHDGSGPVQQRELDWRDVIGDDLAQKILARWPFYASSLGYGP